MINFQRSHLTHSIDQWSMCSTEINMYDWQFLNINCILIRSKTNFNNKKMVAVIFAGWFKWRKHFVKHSIMWLSNYCYCFAFCGRTKNCDYFVQASYKVIAMRICSCSMYLTWLVLMLFVVYTSSTTLWFSYNLFSFPAICFVCMRFHFKYFMQHEIEIRFDVS